MGYFSGPAEMVVPPLLPRSSFQPNNILENEPEEYSGAKVSLVSYLCNMRAGGIENTCLIIIFAF